MKLWGKPNLSDRLTAWEILRGTSIAVALAAAITGFALIVAWGLVTYWLDLTA